MSIFGLNIYCTQVIVDIFSVYLLLNSQESGVSRAKDVQAEEAQVGIGGAGRYE